jgi:hypothetical protein
MIVKRIMLSVLHMAVLFQAAQIVESVKFMNKDD